MATYYRNCVGKNFNSGIGKCPLNAGHVKAIILIEHGQILPATLTASSIEVACHANRPARIYPLKHIVEFAPEGGEAQTSENGYGGTKIVGYSAFNPTWTMADNDFNLRMNIVRAKGISFDAYFVDDNKVIYGKWNENGEFAGVPLVGIAEGGNLFDTSSDTDLCEGLRGLDGEHRYPASRLRHRRSSRGFGIRQVRRRLSFQQVQAGERG